MSLYFVPRKDIAERLRSVALAASSGPHADDRFLQGYFYALGAIALSLSLEADARAFLEIARNGDCKAAAPGLTRVRRYEY